MDTNSHSPPSTSRQTSTSKQTSAPSRGATHKEIRVTQQGKMKAWIATALEFFGTPDANAEDERTLVLHTLPVSFTTTNTTSSTSTSDTAPSPPTTSLTTATLTVPRLLSVAEIIKREFVKNLVEQKSTREMGLFQYNEIGTLEVLRPDLFRDGSGGSAGEDAAQRAERIIHAMGGQNHPRQTQTPYMRITLSTVERPELLSSGASYQPPLMRKFSKSAKARAKKRAKKDAKTAQAQAETPESMEL